jgi:hypothetical protein
VELSELRLALFSGFGIVASALIFFCNMAAVAYFNEMIANTLDPERYAVWMVPVVSAMVS